MRHRFRVIQGGLGQGGIGQGGIGWPRPEAEPVRPGPDTWSVEIVKASAVTDERVVAWRDLLARMGVPTPVFADPDYLLAAAQHQERGVEPAFAFALAGSAGRTRIEGVVGLVMPSAVWGRGRVRPWQPPGLTLAPTVHPAHAGAVAQALDEGLVALGMRLDRSGAEIEPAASLLERTMAPLRSAVSARRDIPAGNVLGIRPPNAIARDRSEIECVVDPGRIRDAVEDFLGLDARVSARPILDDPSQAIMVRVVTRRFGRRGEACVDLVRRSGRLVAGRIHLGTGAGAVLWKQAEDRRSVVAAVPKDDRIRG
ncbi:hypothetical protein [Methylobacterium sp. Leaf108]|uniref:hypothetical protein n=1 Tax=Methylobacterium sp. Leaf108 TaxID=1736256 RepID=UPI000AE2C483|nr:hypothetical protein [Methylobacterium sp. Leaf108]